MKKDEMETKIKEEAVEIFFTVAAMFFLLQRIIFFLTFSYIKSHTAWLGQRHYIYRLG